MYFPYSRLFAYAGADADADPEEEEQSDFDGSNPDLELQAPADVVNHQFHDACRSDGVSCQNLWDREWSSTGGHEMRPPHPKCRNVIHTVP